MLKKLLIAATTAALLAGPSLSFAYYGFYLGADAGANWGHWTTRDVNGKNVDFGSRGAIGNLFAGYGYNVDRFYLGLEAFLYGASNRSGTKNLGTNPQVQRYISEKYGYGASLMPGVLVTDGILLYLRGGVSRARFQISDTASPLGWPSSNDSISGWHVGGGGQFAMMANLDLRAEYVYTSFNSYTNINGKFTPQDSNLTLGVVYKFA